MHALTGEVAALARGLGGMQPDPNGRSEAVLAAVAHEAALDVDRAVDAVDGTLEGHEESVAGVVDLVAAVLGDRRAQLAVVPAQDLAPRLVADHPDEVGRGDNVGEHERPGDADGFSRPASRPGALAK